MRRVVKMQAENTLWTQEVVEEVDGATFPGVRDRRTEAEAVGEQEHSTEVEELATIGHT